MSVRPIMYAAHFGLNGPPFAITPDPGYLYLSPIHQEALAHLLYGVTVDGGFVQLTGEVGTGKTTLIRTLLEQQLEGVDVALCLNPRLSPEEFVATICDELGVQRPTGDTRLKALVDALNHHLLASHAAGRHTVVIIDEAQGLSIDVLEQVRLLTNLETHRHKLLRMILVGQPELHQTLSRPALRQLTQRITARYHLSPLDRTQTHAYIRHRLTVAGGWPELFTPAARRLIHGYSGGIPRLINIICDRALLGAYSRQQPRIGRTIARRAAREVLRGDSGIRIPGRRWLGAGAVVAALVLIGYNLPQQLLVPEPSTRLADVAVPAVETVPVRQIALDEKLLTMPPDQGLRQLLALWQLDPELATHPETCEAIGAQGLRCLDGTIGWTELRRYNRPVLLTLRDALGEPHPVLLRELHDQQALLDLAGESLRIDTTELMRLWTGEFRLFWRLPTETELLRRGNRGDDVLWLRRQLALAEDQPPAAAVSEVFDAELEQRVRQFQQRHGLTVDGLVGARTLLVLSSLVPEPDTPLLETASADRA